MISAVLTKCTNEMHGGRMIYSDFADTIYNETQE